MVAGSRRALNLPALTLTSLILQARRNYGDLRGDGQAARHRFCGKLMGKAGLEMAPDTTVVSAQAMPLSLGEDCAP